MKRLGWALCVLAALMLTAGPVAAKEEAAEKPKKERGDKKRARGKKARSLLRGEYAMLVNEAGFTDEQKAQLETLVKEMKAAETQSREANKEKIAELKKKMADAREAKNKEAMQAARKQMKELKAAATKPRKEFWDKAMTLLTPEQKIKWAAFKLYRSACGRLGKAKMTDEQKAAARKFCEATAKEFGDIVLAEKRTKEDARTIGQAIKNLQQKITEEILTAEQREAIKRKPKREKGEKKDRPKGGGKKKEGGDAGP